MVCEVQLMKPLIYKLLWMCSYYPEQSVLESIFNVSFLQIHNF